MSSGGSESGFLTFVSKGGITQLDTYVFNGDVYKLSERFGSLSS